MAVEVLSLDLDCRDCTQELKKERGCEDKGMIPFTLDGEMIFRCPKKLVTNLTWEYVDAYRFYKKNLLPSGESYLCESRKYLDAMAIIGSVVDKAETEEFKKISRQKSVRS